MLAGLAHAISWVTERGSAFGFSDRGVKETPVFSEVTSVGLDVHARSVVVAAIDGRSGEVFRARLTPSHAEVIEWAGRWPGLYAMVYEAGPTGLGLARALSAAGLRCEVAASSKLLRPAGDRVKTDARDAVNLARLLWLDEVVPVRIPCAIEELPGIWSALGKPLARI